MQESAALPPADPDLLQQAINTLRVYCGVVLLSFAQHGQGLRETIVRNFIARGMTCTQNIFAVWRAGSDQDAWVLHRSLLDRLLHLHYLGETDSFSDFDDYSFASMYEARQRLLHDQDMRSKIPDELTVIQQRDKARYDIIFAKHSRWHRPRAEEVAKTMGLGFLYKFGYNYASTHVHPMSDDGATDFATLTTPSETVAAPDATVVRNSILVQTLLIQEALNISNMRWRAIAYDFLDQVRSFLGSGDQLFQATMYKIGQSWPASPLCESPTPSDKS